MVVDPSGRWATASPTATSEMARTAATVPRALLPATGRWRAAPEEAVAADGSPVTSRFD